MGLLWIILQLFMTRQIICYILNYILYTKLNYIFYILIFPTSIKSSPKPDKTSICLFSRDWLALNNPRRDKFWKLESYNQTAIVSRLLKHENKFFGKLESYVSCFFAGNKCELDDDVEILIFNLKMNFVE